MIDGENPKEDAAAPHHGTPTAPTMESTPKTQPGRRTSTSTVIRCRGPTVRSLLIGIERKGARNGDLLSLRKAAVAGMRIIQDLGTQLRRQVLHKSTESLRGGKV